MKRRLQHWSGAMLLNPVTRCVFLNSLLPYAAMLKIAHSAVFGSSGPAGSQSQCSPQVGIVEAQTPVPWRYGTSTWAITALVNKHIQPLRKSLYYWYWPWSILRFMTPVTSRQWFIQTTFHILLWTSSSMPVLDCSDGAMLQLYNIDLQHILGKNIVADALSRG